MTHEICSVREIKSSLETGNVVFPGESIDNRLLGKFPKRKYTSLYSIIYTVNDYLTSNLCMEIFSFSSILDTGTVVPSISTDSSDDSG